MKRVWTGWLLAFGLVVSATAENGSVGGLEGSVEIIGIVKRKVEAKLCFRNLGKTPMRIYFIVTEVFNRFQNDYVFVDRNGNERHEIVVSPPHGYRVGAGDFHLIAPGGIWCVRQKIPLPRDMDGGEVVSLRWIYRNRVTRWEGGVETLDGPTHALFGGKRIPGIWSGEISAESAVGKNVSRPGE